MVPKSDVAGLGGIGGGRGKGGASSVASDSQPVCGKGGGGGGGGGGTDEPTSSDSAIAPAPLDEPSINGIIGPSDDLYIGGFPGGGAPVGFH